VFDYETFFLELSIVSFNPVSLSVLFSKSQHYGGVPASPEPPLTTVLNAILLKLILTLIGMMRNTFIPLSFLDQIFSAEFLSKISKLFWR
jgi:hypothetical protein